MLQSFEDAWCYCHTFDLPSSWISYLNVYSLALCNIYLNRIFWESTKFEGLTDLTEPWYGTAYSVEKLTGSTIEVCCLSIS